MLKNRLIDDVFLAATQGSPSDDSEISKEQIAYWATQVRNQLVKSEIEVELKSGRRVPPIYISREDCEPLAIEDLECQADCDDSVYIDLDFDVLDLMDDGGLVRVVTDEQEQVKIISVDILDTIRSLRFAKPSMTNPACYRVGSRIFVEGVKHPEVPFNFLSVYYVKKQDVQALSDTDEVICSDLIAPVLIQTLSEMLKNQMYGSAPDPNNDGQAYNQSIYHRVIGSNNTQVQPPAQ